MEFGLLSTILASFSFEQVIDTVSEKGLKWVELACWPKGATDRRYSGVTHLDIESMDDKSIAYTKDYCNKHNVSISSLGYYPNPMDPDEEKRQFYISHLKKLIVVSNKLGVNMVTTFIGRNPHKSTQDNLDIMPQIWVPILEFAEKNNVKIAIENCPMLFTQDEWPGGKNLMTTPEIWTKVFDILDSNYLGLNFDPSHFAWLQLDYISPVYELKEKLLHVHFKDVKIDHEKLSRVGIMAAPLEYMSPKIPGTGDLQWDKFVKALIDTGYIGPSVIEIEDKGFEGSVEDVLLAIDKSAEYLRGLI